MREILFRGKRKDCNVWEIGNYSKYEFSDGTKHFINGFEYEVYPETVGQFTGLVDKDGRKIFEGDIARYSKPFCCEPRYRIRGVVKFLEGCFCIDRTYLNDWLFDSQGGNTELRDFEVIGNIHDNPELIGGWEYGN